MKTILVLGFVAGAIAMDCSPGYKHKTTLTGISCATSVLSGASCATCCDADKLKCGGYDTAALGCTADYTYDPHSGMTDAAKLAWENKATTTANKAADCCETKATCASDAYTCPAGKKKATANAANKCNGGASTCATSTGCCELDTAKCGGMGVAQGDCTATSKYFPSALEQADAAWSGKAATTKAECCLTKAKCSDATCPAGYKALSNVATTECSGNAASCTPTCCEKDVLKCGGLNAPTCATGMYAGTNDAWKNRAATDGNKDTNCCMANAKCSTYTCPAGYTAKSAAATTDCAGAAASCATNTCCDMITAATCDAFKAQVATSTETSSGTYQLCPLLTVAMGVIAFLSMK